MQMAIEMQNAPKTRSNKSVAGNSSLGKYKDERPFSDREGSSPQKKLNWKDPNPMIPAPKEERVNKAQDWLREQRAKRAEEHSNSSALMRPQKINWAIDVSKMDLNDAQRIEMVQQQARIYEDAARRKEQLMLLQGKQRNVEDTIEVNNMIVESIRTKLNILKDFTQE